MSWRAETSRDLQEAQSRLQSALDGIEGEPTEAQWRAVWLAYAWVEKSVAFIKTELDEDSPGRTVAAKVYKVPDHRQAVRFALDRLQMARELFSAGDLRSALKTLRESRNYLRVLLRERNLKRRRAASARGV